MRVYRIGTVAPRWIVLLPDGSTVSVLLRTWNSHSLLDVTIQLSSVRAGTMTGLCGTNDGNKFNDLVGFDGLQHGST